MVNKFLLVEQSEYYNNMQKFVFVAVDFKESEVRKVLPFFNTYMIINVVVIGNFDGTFKAFSLNPFFLKQSRYFYALDPTLTSIDEVFPDKLKDFNGYTFNVAFWVYPPRVVITNGILQSPEFKLMHQFVMSRNAKISLLYLEKIPNNQGILQAIGNNDVVLNTEISFVNGKSRLERNVNTFETDGYCAMIPLPSRKSSFGFIFEPFDLWTWIFIVLSMFSGGIVWHFLNKISQIPSNTPGYFIFGFIANFLGQLIPFRRHQSMQKLILQLTIMLTFILGTAYQSLIISSIMDSRNGERITTIDEMINSNYSFYVTNTFKFDLNGSEYFQKMSPRILNESASHFKSFKTLASENIAIVQTCSNIDFSMNHVSNGLNYNDQAIHFYYKLNEAFSTFYLNFPLGDFTVIMQTLNEFSLRVLESGIRQHWNKKNPSEDLQALKMRRDIENEKYLLDLNDVYPARIRLFVCLLSG